MGEKHKIWKGIVKESAHLIDLVVGEWKQHNKVDMKKTEHGRRVGLSTGHGRHSAQDLQKSLKPKESRMRK